MENKEKYVCKECGKEAFIIDEKIIRSCDHKTTIILQINVVVTGDGCCST